MAALSDRPITASLFDAPFYVERQVDRRVSWAAESGLNVLVLGTRGTGKTSLLHMTRAAYENAHPDSRAVMVPGSLAEDSLELLGLVLYSLRRGESVSAVERTVQAFSVRVPRGQPGSPVEETLALLDELRSEAEQHEHCLVCLDDPRPLVAAALFGRLRDEIWQLPISWIVTADPQDRATLLKPPADAFFETVVELERFTPPEADSALSRRLKTQDAGYNAEMVDLIASEANGNPRDLIRLARRSLLEGLDIRPEAARRQKARGQARDLGETALRVFDYVDAHGPTSPSDEQLQGALDLSHARIANLMREMELAGLLVASSQRTESRGRPRKVYSVRAANAESEPDGD